MTLGVSLTTSLLNVQGPDNQICKTTAPPLLPYPLPSPLSPFSPPPHSNSGSFLSVLYPLICGLPLSTPRLKENYRNYLHAVFFATALGGGGAGREGAAGADKGEGEDRR